VPNIAILIPLFGNQVNNGVKYSKVELIAPSSNPLLDKSVSTGATDEAATVYSANPAAAIELKKKLLPIYCRMKN
jgi:hypothetical protein